MTSYFERRIPDKNVRAALMMAASSTMLLLGYEFIRNASHTLFKSTYGTKNYPTVMAAVPVLLLAVLWVYGKILGARGPQKTLLTTILVSNLVLMVGYTLSQLNVPLSHALLLMTSEIYVMFIIEQYWSFINSILTTEQAKRWNGYILGISTSGGIMGGVLVSQLAERWGTQQMVLVAAVFGLPCWWLARKAYAISGYDPVETSSKHHHQTTDKYMGWKYFRTHPILISIFAMVLLSQFFGFFAHYHFQMALDQFKPQWDEQTAFSGMFYSIVNSCAVAIKLLILPYVLPRYKMKTIHFFVVGASISLALMAVTIPHLWTASAMLLFFKALDYSAFRAAKEVLYIPLPTAARFQTKEIIDVFGYRFGKAAMSGGTAIFQNLLPSIAINNVAMSMVCAVFWLGAVFTLPSRS